MTKEEAAARLDGNKYRNEGSRALFAEMKAVGLVAVYGASDDLMEFRGAVHDEVGCYDGGETTFTAAGLLANKCSNDKCPYHAKEKKNAATVKAIWDDGGYSWRYETRIPHAQFTIVEDGESYCRGIVFALSDLHTVVSP